MRILVFGATGMVGQGVLREALRAEDVTLVQTIGRTPTGVTHPKLREVGHGDLLDYTAVEGRLAGFDACFFCLGASSVGMNEAGYTRVNYEIPVAAGRALSRLNADLTFNYVSGAGTGSQRAMWARVKRRTEEALLAMPFKAAYMFRPGIIQPLHGARSKTRLYRAFYVATSPLLSLARRLFPAHVLSTEEVGVAMLNVVRHGAPKPILESADIRALLDA